MSKSKHQWIPCTEKMPKIEYDYLGNCISPMVLLLMNNVEEFKVCTGHLTSLGIFEGYEDGPVFIGRPNKEVIAWFPFPDASNLKW